MSTIRREIKELEKERDDLLEKLRQRTDHAARLRAVQRSLVELHARLAAGE